MSTYLALKVIIGDTIFSSPSGEGTAILHNDIQAMRRSSNWQGKGSTFISQLFSDPEYRSSPRNRNLRPPSLQSSALVLPYDDGLTPLSPKIHIQIFHADIHTFSLEISWESLTKDQSNLSLVIIWLILVTISLDNIRILLGENWCWSLLGLKGLKPPFKC